MNYELIEASFLEWGLLENGQPVRTWLKAELGDNPTLDHPKVMETIEIQRLMAAESKNTGSAGKSFFTFAKSLRNAAFYNVDFFTRFRKNANEPKH